MKSYNKEITDNVFALALLLDRKDIFLLKQNTESLLETLENRKVSFLYDIKRYMVSVELGILNVYEPEFEKIKNASIDFSISKDVLKVSKDISKKLKLQSNKNIESFYSDYGDEIHDILSGDSDFKSEYLKLIGESSLANAIAKSYKLTKAIECIYGKSDYDELKYLESRLYHINSDTLIFFKKSLEEKINCMKKIKCDISDSKLLLFSIDVSLDIISRFPNQKSVISMNPNELVVLINKTIIKLGGFTIEI